MLKPNGAAELTVFTEKSYKETITPIVPGIWHVLGVGHSNAVIIEGRTSVILVDTLDTLLLFTSKGNYAHLPVYQIDEAKWKDVGSHLNKYVSIDGDDKIINAVSSNSRRGWLGL